MVCEAFQYELLRTKTEILESLHKENYNSLDRSTRVQAWKNRCEEEQHAEPEWQMKPNKDVISRQVKSVLVDDMNWKKEKKLKKRNLQQYNTPWWNWKRKKKGNEDNWKNSFVKKKKRMMLHAASKQIRLV